MKCVFCAHVTALTVLDTVNLSSNASEMFNFLLSWEQWRTASDAVSCSRTSFTNTIKSHIWKHSARKIKTKDPPILCLLPESTSRWRLVTVLEGGTDVCVVFQDSVRQVPWSRSAAEPGWTHDCCTHFLSPLQTNRWTGTRWRMNGHKLCFNSDSWGVHWQSDSPLLPPSFSAGLMF